ncbi:MAG: FG-GAP-like repeat-containing protein [Bacteroidota bacterium]
MKTNEAHIHDKNFISKRIQKWIVASLAVCLLLPFISDNSYGQEAVSNPFSLEDIGQGTTPAFTDLDDDGDLDLLIGSFDGEFVYFPNVGTSINPSFGTKVTNAFGLDVGSASSPTLADLDDDGDLDLLSGESQGNFRYYENTGDETSATFGSAQANPFGLSDVGAASIPHFVDLDDDGDYDVLVASLGVDIYYFENIGSKTSPSFDIPQINPFGLINNDNSYLTTIDIDNDGDLDVMLGADNGTMELYENIGMANDPSFEAAAYNTFGNSDVGADAAVTSGDLNGDGDTDLLVGTFAGDLFFFEVRISTLPTSFLDPVENPFSLTDATAGTDGSAPVFIDLDNDDDFDVLSGSFNGTYYYYENSGSVTAPEFEAVAVNPFGLTESGFSAIPTFADIDDDGDLDLLSGENSGNFIYFENTGSVSNPTFAAASFNPFGLTKLTSRSSPVFVDLDNDEDYDILAGNALNGDIIYFQNTGTKSAPAFAAAQVNIFGLEENGSSSSIITMADLDDDNDLDLIIGTFGNEYYYAENIGTVSSPDFALPRPFITTDYGRTPSGIADLDGDTDPDILIGSSDGEFYYLQNTEVFVNNPPVFTFTGPGTLPGIAVLENSEGVALDIDGNDGNGGATDVGITYSLSGVDAGVFSIGEETGELSFLSPPDFETPLDNGEDNFYNITVTIDDGFPSNNTTSENFFIIVSNVSEPIIWLGNSTDWSAASNWSTGAVPTEDDDVEIPSTTNDPEISQTGLEVNDLVVADLVTLTINSGTGLVVNGDQTFNGSAQVSISRDVEDNLGYSIVGSPLEGQTVEDLGADVVYQFNGFTNEYSIPSSTANVFPSNGFFVAYDSPDATLTLTGVPRNDQSTKQVFNNDNPSDNSNEGYNLVANPFISGLDRSALVNGNSSSITGSVWYWHDGGSNSGGSRSGDYVAVTDVGVTSSDPAIDITPSTPIGMMQGFFVRSSRPTGQIGSVIFAKSMQVSDGGADEDFFRLDRNNEPNTFIKLSLSGQGKLSDLYNDLIVTFRNDASVDTDFGLDAEKFSGNENISFYSMQGDMEYAIQALPNPENQATEVALGYYLKNEGSYQLKVEALKLNRNQSDMYLIDHKTREIISLDQSSVIEIDITEESISNRYAIRLVPNVVTSISAEPANQLVLIKGTESYVSIKYTGRESKFRIYELNGQLLTEFNNTFSKEPIIIPVPLKRGKVYLLKAGNEKLKFSLR